MKFLVVLLMLLVLVISCTRVVSFRDVPEIRIVQPTRVDTVILLVTDTVYSVYTQGIIEMVYYNNPPDGYRVLAPDLIEFYYPSGKILYKCIAEEWKRMEE